MNLYFIKFIWDSFLREIGRSARLATDFHPVPNLRISAAVNPFPHSFHGVCWGKKYFI